MSTISSTAFEASGHGWWVNYNCKTSSALLTVQLQQYYSDGVWRNKGEVGVGTGRSGGGSGARVTGRAPCTGGSKLTTNAQNIPCRRL